MLAGERDIWKQFKHFWWEVVEKAGHAKKCSNIFGRWGILENNSNIFGGKMWNMKTINWMMITTILIRSDLFIDYWSVWSNIDQFDQIYTIL